MRPLVGPETVVVPLQNGVEAATELTAVFGPNTLGGMCGTLSFIVGPGHIRSVGGQNFIKFGELDNKLTERIVGDKGLRQLIFDEEQIKQARVKQEIEDRARALVVERHGALPAVHRRPRFRTDWISHRLSL
jgi:ketopantoate reductase